MTPLVARPLLAQRLRVRLRESVVHAESVALRGERGEPRRGCRYLPTTSAGCAIDQGCRRHPNSAACAFAPNPRSGSSSRRRMTPRRRGHLQQVHQAGIRQVGDLAGNRYRLHDTTHMRVEEERLDRGSTRKKKFRRREEHLSGDVVALERVTAPAFRYGAVEGDAAVGTRAVAAGAGDGVAMPTWGPHRAPPRCRRRARRGQATDIGTKRPGTGAPPRRPSARPQHDRRDRPAYRPSPTPRSLRSPPRARASARAELP